MNLLIDNWIPVRPRNGGKVQIINLQSLYCSRDQWRLSLPRDDMELAALALLVCIGQIIAPAKDDVEFRHRIMNPLTEDEFQQLIAPWIDMFYLNHAEHPFMQTKGVKANDVTPMEKLLAGVSGATNCAFVNQPGQGEALCGGCTAIALFNQANQAPGFGGGFKSGLRGGTPVTTFVRGIDLVQRCYSMSSHYLVFKNNFLMNHIRKTNLPGLNLSSPMSLYLLRQLGLSVVYSGNQRILNYAIPLGLVNVLAVDRKAICVIPVFLRKNLPLQLMGYGPIRIPLVW